MAQTDNATNAVDGEPEKHAAGAFDIRTFIAALMGLYGLALTVVGIVDTPDDQLAKSDGLNINLWTGIALIVFAVVFQAWAKLRPVVVPDDVERADVASGSR